MWVHFMFKSFYLQQNCFTQFMATKSCRLPIRPQETQGFVLDLVQESHQHIKEQHPPPKCV